MTKKFKSTSIQGLTIIAALILTLGLSACSGSDDEATVQPLPDQDASGLFKDGTAQLDGGAVMLSDLRGFVHNDRIMMFSIAGHVLFDGQINSLLSDDYEATVDVYENGVKTQSDVAVTGTVLTESTITGTVSGTGKASGDFTLTFDPLYSRGATFARVDTNSPSSPFTGDIKNTMVDAETFNFEFTIVNIYEFSSITPSFIRCRTNGSYTVPDSNINIFALNEIVTQTDPECTMSETPEYTGFAAAVDDTFVDDTLVYAVSNGVNAQFAVLTK